MSFYPSTIVPSKSISRAWQAQAKIVWMTSCFSSLCVWSWSFKQLDWPGWVVAGQWGGVHWGGFSWDVRLGTTSPTEPPEEYEADPTRCCPWCTESQRRRAVHAGNERKQEELATAVEKKGLPLRPDGTTLQHMCSES